jgi:hypothetical protein
MRNILRNILAVLVIAVGFVFSPSFDLPLPPGSSRKS